jgi:folylpolyglutamate synthase/dihydropteroate synthase
MRDIASAKAGIIKQNGKVLFYGENPEAEAVIRKNARR